MSEALGAGGGGGAGCGGYSQGADHLPPFSSFNEEGEHRLLQDTRLLDISWDYYGADPNRLIEARAENGIAILGQPQYRPWEPAGAGKDAVLRSGFADAKLPSFQSQFQAFPENAPGGESLAPTAVGVSSPGPAPSPATLTPLAPAAFHTLTAVNPRTYALPLAPQYLDERHLLYQPNLTLNFQPQNGLLHQNGTLIQNIPNQTVVHVLKNEPPPFEMKIGNTTIPISQDTKFIPNGLHHSNFQNPITTVLDNSYDIGKTKSNGFPNGTSPTRSDFRKKERRKIRANSLESNGESDGSGMEIGSESSGQVAAVSSTAGAGFKSPMHASGPGSAPTDMDDISSEKQVFSFFFATSQLGYCKISRSDELLNVVRLAMVMFKLHANSLINSISVDRIPMMQCHMYNDYRLFA